jgi:hypothetical protein
VTATGSIYRRVRTNVLILEKKLITFNIRSIVSLNESGYCLYHLPYYWETHHLPHAVYLCDTILMMVAEATKLSVFYRCACFTVHV